MFRLASNKRRNLRAVFWTYLAAAIALLGFVVTCAAYELTSTPTPALTPIDPANALAFPNESLNMLGHWRGIPTW